MRVAAGVLYMLLERLVLVVLAAAAQALVPAPAHQELPTLVGVVVVAKIVNLAATAALAS